jgi:tetratricopeptide (TPR) repeat protein
MRPGRHGGYAGERARPGTVIGPYKLLEQIGEGGFGVVFMAEQTQPVRRKVALKILKPGMDTRQVVARFEAERQALALMDHPNIAKVLDGGQTTTGRPYFVMDLVKGLPITEYCDQAQLTTRERLELFVQVCQAVQHAHQKGVIYRDLKPSNVLVTVHDTTAVVKVIDFGVAKALGQELTDKTLYTGFAQMVGTPLYMSPEQAGESSLDVDTRSDIYALGVLLYELLTGTTPFEKERFKEAGYDEIRRIIREEDPPRPSTRISTLGQAATTAAMQRKSDPKRLSQLLRGEVDWIVMKCLEKDRNRRYETASALAADVQRYLNDEPVLACPPSKWYLFRKYARRNKTAVTVTGLVLVLLASVGGGISWVVRDWEARQARTLNALELTLDRAEFLLQDGKRGEAKATLDRADTLAAEAPADPARDRRRARLKEWLAAEARDQQFIARFEDIRLRAQSQVIVGESRFDFAAAFPKIRDALGEYGIAPGVVAPAEAAARIRGRPESVRRDLLAALHECFWQAPQEERQTRQWLATTLEAADTDRWRVQVRRAIADRDLKTFAKQLHQVNVRGQPPSFLLIVANILPTEMKSTRLQLLRRIQHAYPADFWANLVLAMVLEEGGKTVEAIRYFTAALALRPRNAGIYVNRGAALRDAGELDAAIADFREALALAPEYAMPRRTLGDALRDKGRLDEAIAEYRDAIRLKKDFPEAHCNLGNVLRRKGQLDEAIAEFREAIATKQDFPELYRAHYSLGLALYQKGQLDNAIAEFREAIRVKKDFAEAHRNLGILLQRKGQLDEAVAMLRTAIKLDPKNVRARGSLALALRMQGKLEQAIAEYRQAIKLDPKDARLRNNLATALGSQGRLDETIAQLQSAIELDPKLATAHSNLGAALYRQGKLDQAIAECRKAIELGANDANAHYYLGAALRDLGKLEKAIASYWKAIQINPRFAQQANDLGWRLATAPDPKQRDGRQAVAFAELAVKAAPTEGNYWNTLGAAQYRAGNWKEAVAALEKSMQLRKGGDAFDWFFLAMAHRQLGDKENAHQWFDQAVQWMDKQVPKHDELRRFRAEAAELLKVKEKLKEEKKK